MLCLYVDCSACMYTTPVCSRSCHPDDLVSLAAANMCDGTGARMEDRASSLRWRCWEAAAATGTARGNVGSFTHPSGTLPSFSDVRNVGRSSQYPREGHSTHARHRLMVARQCSTTVSPPRHYLGRTILLPCPALPYSPIYDLISDYRFSPLSDSLAWVPLPPENE